MLRRFIPKCWLFIMAIFVSILFHATPSWCALSGFAEWRYADYQRETADQTNELEASHFTQKYSLMYSTSGLIKQGRLGYYNVGFGAEWAAFESEIGYNDVKKDAFKLLYNGEVLVAPGALPFRFFAYSRDVTSTYFADDLIPDNALIFPGIVTDMNNGQTIVSGATLVAGIRNGSYGGRYRELLSKFPRLLMDYKDIYVRDTKAETPEHHRLRKLAFVSLNKKDNWFHYRYTDYHDYEDRTENWTEKEYMLGTIDHLLRRQWINLTNWIKMSVDGSYTETNSPYASSIGQQERYVLNLFTRAQRRNWGIFNYNTFSRTRDGARVTRKLDMPVFAQLTLNPATILRTNLVLDRELETFEGLDKERGHDTYYGAARLTTFKTRRNTFSPYLEAEYNEEKTFGRNEGQAIRIGAQLSTNSQYRGRASYLIDYNLTALNSENDSDNNTYLENVLTLSGQSQLGLNSQVGLTQTLIAGFGDPSGGTRYIGARGNGGLPSDKGVGDRVENYLYQSITEGFIEHIRGRLRNRVLISLDYIYAGGVDTKKEFRTEHVLKYNKKVLSLESTSTYYWSDNLIDDLSYSSLQGDQINGSRTSNQIFTNRSRLEYTPNKNWNLRSGLSFTWDQGDLGSNTFYSINERLKYTFYTANGIVRRWAEFTQSFVYENLDRWNGESIYGTTTNFGATFYPYRVLTLGGDIAYRTRSVGEDDIYLGLNAKLNYPKLQVVFDYKYAARPEDGKGQKEHRWEVSVRKTL